MRFVASHACECVCIRVSKPGDISLMVSLLVHLLRLVTYFFAKILGFSGEGRPKTTPQEYDPRVLVPAHRIGDAPPACHLSA